MFQREEEGRIILLEEKRGAEEVDKIKCAIRVGTWIGLRFDGLKRELSACENVGGRGEYVD